VEDISDIDLVAEEETFVTISKEGYMKRMKPDVYRTQKRGGKGVVGAVTKEGDYIKHALICSTHDELLLFTNRGRVYITNVYDIPEFSRNAKGLPAINLVQIGQNELITSVLTRGRGKKIKSEEETTGDNTESLTWQYLFMATKNGTVKKTTIANFEKIRATGLIAIKLDEGDELEWVKPTTGDDDILLITRKGRSIRFDESDVRPTGRSTRGVRGIKFKFDDDVVVSMDTINNNKMKIFTISENGYGKMTAIKGYPKQNRGGSGVYTFRVTDKTGDLVSARGITNPAEREVFVISEKGIVIRSKMDKIPTLGRQTSGVRVMKLNKDDKGATMALI
jgi:DNA gyrase subunit A